MRHFRLMAAFIALLAVPLPGRAAADASIADFVRTVDQAMRAAGQGGEPRSRCRALVGRVMDIDYMSRHAIGEVWGRMTPTQRGIYRRAFEGKMSAHCVNSLRDFSGQSMVLLGSRPSGGEQLATTRMSGGGGQVTWRLRRGGSQGWRAVDVIKDGRSALIMARDEYAAVLNSNQGSIDALIAFLHR